MHIDECNDKDKKLGHTVCREESTRDLSLWEIDEDQRNFWSWGANHNACHYLFYKGYDLVKHNHESWKVVDQVSAHLTLMLTCHRM
jgi:predicted SprT family Zn-dependent metalloprotease